MVDSVQVWVLTGLVGFLVAVLLMLFKKWLDDNKGVITAINELKLEYIKQNEQLKTLFNQHVNLRGEIKELKQTVARLQRRCRNCDIN